MYSICITSECSFCSCNLINVAAHFSKCENALARSLLTYSLTQPFVRSPRTNKTKQYCCRMQRLCGEEEEDEKAIATRALEPRSKATFSSQFLTIPFNPWCVPRKCTTAHALKWIFSYKKHNKYKQCDKERFIVVAKGIDFTKFCS